jgi:transcriptional regulator with XRE-family HTH domain
MRKHSFQELVASNVRAELKRERWSAHKAAETLGWSGMYLSRRLRSETAFDLNDLETLAGLLKIDVRVFFDDPVGSESLNVHYWTETLLTRPEDRKRPRRNPLPQRSPVTPRKQDIGCNTMTLAA